MSTNNLTVGNVWLSWHTRKASELRHELARTTCPVRQAELIASLNPHIAAVNQIDKAAQAADRKVTA